MAEQLAVQLQLLLPSTSAILFFLVEPLPVQIPLQVAEQLELLVAEQLAVQLQLLLSSASATMLFFEYFLEHCFEDP